MRTEPVTACSRPPGNTTSTRTSAATTPTPRDVATLRAPSVAGAGAVFGAAGIRVVGVVSMLMTVSLSQWVVSLLSSVVADAVAHAGQMAGIVRGSSGSTCGRLDEVELRELAA